MTVSNRKQRQAIETKSLPLGHRMLALEPRYVFDAALAAELYDLAYVDPASEPVPATGEGTGEAVVVAAEELAAAGAAVEAYVDAHNISSFRGEIAFIDSSLGDLGTLVSAVPEGVRIVLIDSARDGVLQMAEAMAGYDDVTGIHIVSHGEAGRFSLGSSSLDAVSMTTIHRDALAAIAAHLSEGADILVYGCNFAAGDIGAQAVAVLAGLTGADVSASEDLTGGARAGGDWELEARTGAIEAESIAAVDYSSTLVDTNSGAWSIAGTTATNTTAGITTTVTFTPNTANSAFGTVANGTFNTIPVFSNGADGDPSLSFVFTWDTTPEPIVVLPQPQASIDSGVGTITITFSQPVTNPIINLDRLGGNSSYDPNTAIAGDEESISNGARWTIVTPSATLTEISGTSHFDVTATTIERTPNQAMNYTGTSSESGTNPLTNTAAGSVQVNGTFTTITFQLTGVGAEGGGQDGIEIGFILDALPIANNDAFSVNEDATLTGNLYANNGAGTDSDPQGDTLTIAQINGTAFTVGAPITLPHGTLTITNATTGSFTFVPNADYVGSETFTYTISDANGGTDTATASINVTPVNDSPVGVDDTIAVIEDTPNTQNVLGNDTDPEGDPLTISSAAIDYNGDGNPDPILLDTPNAIVTSTGEAIGVITVNANGDVTFVPSADYAGPIPDLIYTPNDGTADGSPAIVSLGTVLPVNDPPAGGDNAFTLLSNQTHTFAPAEFGFSDPLDSPANTFMAVIVTTLPGSGTLALSGNPIVPGQEIAVGDIANLVFTPSGVGATSFTFQVRDDGGDGPNLVVNGSLEDYDIPDALDIVELQAYYDTVPPPADVVSPAELAGWNRVVLDDNGSFYVPEIYLVDDPDAANNGLPETPYGDQQGYTGLVWQTISGLVPGTSYTLSGSAVIDQPETRFVLMALDDVDFDGTLPLDQSTFAPVMPTSSLGSAQLEGAVDGTDPSWREISFTFVAPASGTVDLLVSKSTTATVAACSWDNISLTQANIDTDPVANTISFTVGSPNQLPSDGDETNQVTEDATLAVPAAFGLLVNGTDGDGDPLVVTGYEIAGIAGTQQLGAPVTIPNVGSVAISGDGSYAFTPVANYSGPVPVITYTVEDGNGGSDTSTLTLTMVPVNDPPEGSTSPLTTPEETPVSGTVTGTDREGDPLGYTLVSSPNNGTVNFNPDGSFTYTPGPNYVGSDNFVVEVDDSHGGTDTVVVPITVTPVNDPPLDGDETDFVTEDAALAVPSTAGLLVNGSDVDGGPLAVTGYEIAGITGTQPLGSPVTITGVGSVIINADGSYAFAPVANYSGPIPVITYTVEDGSGGTDTSTLTLAMVPVNDPPVGAASPLTTPENTPVSGTVTGTDPDGDPLAITLVSSPSNGTLALNPDGSFTYTPGPEYVGADTFVVELDDGHGGTDTVVIPITVTPVNDPPVFADPDPTPGTPYISGDSNNLWVAPIDNVAMTLPLAPYYTDPNGDPLAITPDMTGVPAWLSYDPATNTFSGTPPGDNAGTPIVIPIVVDDANGGVFNGTITIAPQNPSPAVNPDQTSTPFDTPVAVEFLANDSDPDGDPLTITSATVDPAQGTIGLVGADWVFTPVPGFVGQALITYTVEDQDGATASSTHLVTVLNAPPVLADPDPTPATPFIDPGAPGTLHVPAIDNVPLTVPLDLYFADPNGDPLSYTPNMTGVPSWLVFDPATNTFTGTPPADNAGPVTIPVVADDGQGGTYAATIVIEPANPAPDAIAGTTVTSYATPVVVDLLTNDTDPDGDPLTVTSATLQDPTTGTLSQDPATKVITFTPASGFSGNAVITYTIQDQDGATDTAIHTVTVENAPPVLADPDPAPETPFIDPGDPGTLHVPATDNVPVAVPLDLYFADPNGDPLTYVPDMAGVPTWLTFDPATNTFTGTPPADNGGPLTIPVIASDGNGGVYAATIVIEATNPGPDAVDASATTAYAAPILVDLLANDTDPDGDPLTVVGTPSVDPAQGAMTQDPLTGAWTFTPAIGFAGNAVITYTVEDQDGLTDTAIHTVAVVAPAKPIAVNDVYTTSYGVALNGAAGSNDTVLPGSVFTALSQPLSGTLAFNPDGTYTYVPQSGFVGTDSFAYEVEDATGQKAMAFEVIRITPPAIVAVSDTSTTPFETTLNGAVGANDTYASGSSFIAITAPSHGTLSLNADGTYVYTPATGFTGTDMFAYAVTDPTGQTRFATNTIAVVPPLAPVAVDDTFATSYATPVTGNAATGDTLHAASSFAATSQPTHGTLVFNPDGTFTYSPSAGFAGTDTFTYTVTDILGQTSTATEIITVAAPAIAAVDDSYATGYATPVVGNAATGDTYAPGSVFTLASAPAHGTATMNPDGTYTYTPQVGFAGTDSFVYAITDPTGQIVAATETITVAAPVLVAVDDVFTNVYGLPISGNAGAGDSFPPGSVFTVTATPTHGTVTMNADGTYIYSAAVGFAGSDTFSYSVTDPTGQVVIATETIIITPPPLIAVGDTLTSAFNTPVNGDVASGDTFASGSVFSVASPPAQGTIAMNPDGTFRYTPPGNFAGTVTFTYQVTDPTGQTATATETIVVGRPQLIATDDVFATPYNTPLNGNAAVGDTAAAGSVYRAVTTPTYGSLTMNANGTYQYIPQPDFVGVDTFTYSITDPTGQLVTAVETITVNARSSVLHCLTTFGQLNIRR